MKTRGQRFVSFLKEGGACWEWTGTHTRSGYGMFSWEGKTRTTAHRASYRLFIGEIPEGWEIDHACHNRGCVNPNHLRAVTVKENRALRDVARGVRLPNGRKTHCKHGHPFAGDNLAILPNGSRACRACNRRKTAEYRSRRHN